MSRIKHGPLTEADDDVAASGTPPCGTTIISPLPSSSFAKPHAFPQLCLFPILPQTLRSIDF
jgi:hypothetical protein